MIRIINAGVLTITPIR